VVEIGNVGVEMVLEDQVNEEEEGAGEETTEPIGEMTVNLLGANLMGDRAIDNLGDLDDRMETHGLVEQLRRTSDPRSRWDPKRVCMIQEAVTIGPLCSAPQREWVLTLVAEFADVFALTLSEVRPVKFIEHKIHVPQGVKLPLHHRTKPLTEGQRAWFHRRVDKLVEAGIVMPISFHDVKCVNAVVMADKKSGKKSRSMEELRILANAACRKAGVAIPHPQSPADKSMVLDIIPGDDEENYRLCIDFLRLNAVAPVASFPMGDLARKQNKMAGKRWYIGLDLAAAYHACMIHKADWGYTAFQVEDRGFYCWVRTPFGLNGAPGTCHEMILAAFDDMMGVELESMMDDICEANDDFDTLFNILEKTLLRCRKLELSLSPSKVELFMD
jgi:Reverse transcriptase (RNA-dependent DNA polymerase)